MEVSVMEKINEYLRANRTNKDVRYGLLVAVGVLSQLKDRRKHGSVPDVPQETIDSHALWLIRAGISYDEL